MISPTSNYGEQSNFVSAFTVWTDNLENVSTALIDWKGCCVYLEREMSLNESIQVVVSNVIRKGSWKLTITAMPLIQYKVVILPV